MVLRLQSAVQPVFSSWLDGHAFMQALGYLRLSKMIRYLLSRGTGMLVGECLRQNSAMTKLARGLGFGLIPSVDVETRLFALDLQPFSQAAQSIRASKLPRGQP
jgi:hypothetical protein